MVVFVHYFKDLFIPSLGHRPTDTNILWVLSHFISAYFKDGKLYQLFWIQQVTTVKLCGSNYHTQSTSFDL